MRLMAATSAGASEAEPRELGESGKLPFALGQMLKCFWRLGVPLELCFGQLLGPFWGARITSDFTKCLVWDLQTSSVLTAD